MKKLEKLYFLIHGFCYAEMAGDELVLDSRLQPYLKRESDCAERWRARLSTFSNTDGLVIIPGPGGCGTHLGTYASLAISLLGNRCFILDCPDCNAPEFWSHADNDFRGAIMDELRAAFVQQQLQWNKEEIITDLHCLACCRQGLVQK